VSDSLPLLSQSSESAAKRILQACQDGDAELVLPAFSRVLLIAQELAPNLTAEVLTLVNKMLPKMGGIGTRAAKGYASTSQVSESVLTYLTQKAARRNNQINTH